MARIYKFFRAVFVLALVALAGLAIVISYDSGCPSPVPASSGQDAMKVYTQRCYGGPEVLRLEPSPVPVPADDQVLIKVRAVSVNPFDWHVLRGSPYIMRLGSGIGAPKDIRLGVDFAGVVAAVGKDVRRFHPGDAVFGGAPGAFAEYVVVRENRALALKPANVSFEQAAAVNIAAITALQALRDRGRLQAGQKVLINGASGGVGTFAVQIAKSLGAEVTGVCSTRNLERVRALGADQVIDYTREDFTTSAARYDLVIDLVGNHGPLAIKRVLAADGRLVIVGGPKGNWIGPMTGAISAFVLSPFVQQDMGMMLAELSQKDLEFLSSLMQAGTLTPVIDRSYRFDQLPEAIRYLEEGHAQGKVVVTMAESGEATGTGR